MNFNIQPATPNDIVTVLSLMRKFAVEDGLQSDSILLTESSFSRYGFGKDKCFDCDLGAVNGEVVSYMLYSKRFSGITGKPILYIEDIYLQAGFRGNGFGKALMKHAKEVANTSNCSRIELVVDSGNVSAQKFYLNLGAHLMSNLIVGRFDLELSDNA